MVENIKSILKAIIEQADIKAFDDFENVDTLRYPDEQIAFFNVKNIEVSRWVRAFDGKSYGAEVSGTACVRLMGRRGIFDDCTELEESISQLTELLGFRSELIITSLKKEDIEENRRLGRLEGEILIGFKMLMSDGKLQGGS